MKLSELFKKLSYSELSNLALSGEGSGVIIEAKIPKMIQATNDALKDIYTRLVIMDRQVIVKTLDYKNLYYLRKEHAVTDSTPGVLKYIIDTPSNKFTGDVVQVLRVYNEIGQELPLNDTDQWASVFTPTYDCVQFNHPGSSQIFNVAYQALHPELSETVTNPLEQEVLIPPVLEEALRMKIAYCVFAAMSGQDSTTKAQLYLASYETRLSEIVEKNLFNNVGLATNTKLHRRGFV